MYNINIEENENRYEYIYRIYRAKDLGLIDLNNNELGEIVAKNLNEDFDESAYRKFYQPIAIAEEYNLLDKKTNEEFKEIQNAMIELKKEKVKTRDERTELNRKIREQARKESYIELIQHVISDFPPLEVPENCLKTNSDNDLIVNLSDIHAGIKIDNFWNKYDTNIMAERFANYLNEICRIKKTHNSENCYLVIGEIVSGLIHENLRLENNQNLAEQFISVSSLIASFITKLSTYFNEVNVYITPGNHSRMVANRNASLKGENFDNLLPHFLEAKLQNNDRVHVCGNNVEESIACFKVRNSVVMASHGDKDSVDNVVQNLTMMFRTIPDIVLLQHRHTNAMKTVYDTKVIQNGCVSGSDNYALDKRLKNKPEQTVLVVTSRGLDCIYDVQVGEYNE